MKIPYFNLSCKSLNLSLERQNILLIFFWSTMVIAFGWTLDTTSYVISIFIGWFVVPYILMKKCRARFHNFEIFNSSGKKIRIKDIVRLSLVGYLSIIFLTALEEIDPNLDPYPIISIAIPLAYSFILDAPVSAVFDIKTRAILNRVRKINPSFFRASCVQRDTLPTNQSDDYIYTSTAYSYYPGNIYHNLRNK